MRNTKIKDTMRDTCIAELVNSWYQILVSTVEGKIFILNQEKYIIPKVLNGHPLLSGLLSKSRKLHPPLLTVILTPFEYSHLY